MLSLQKKYDTLIYAFFLLFFEENLLALKRVAPGVQMSNAIGSSRESNPSRKIRPPREVPLGLVAAKDFASMLHAAFSTRKSAHGALWVGYLSSAVG